MKDRNKLENELIMRFEQMSLMSAEVLDKYQEKLYNKYGFTSQVPSVIEVTSNIATTKQRKINVDGYDIIVYKPIIEITDNNINELEFMALMTDIDQFSEKSGDELKMKLREYINKKNIDFNIVKVYLPLFPDKIYKNLYNGGLMNELV